MADRAQAGLGLDGVEAAVHGRSDGAKKLVGRKRVALVDAGGHLLALAVVPANVQDRDALPTLDDGKVQWPSLRLAILDGAFTAGRCEEWCHLHGMRHRVVEKNPEQKGFVVLERRWLVVRRTILPIRRSSGRLAFDASGWLTALEPITPRFG